MFTLVPSTIVFKTKPNLYMIELELKKKEKTRAYATFWKKNALPLTALESTSLLAKRPSLELHLKSMKSLNCLTKQYYLLSCKRFLFFESFETATFVGKHFWE